MKTFSQFSFFGLEAKTSGKFIYFRESGPSYHEETESASEKIETPEPTEADRVDTRLREADLAVDIADRLFQKLPDVGEIFKGEIASCREELDQLHSMADYLRHCSILTQASKEYGPSSEIEVINWDPNPPMPEDLDMTQEQWDELHIEEKEYIINSGMDVLIDPIDIIVTGGVVTLAKVGGKLSFAVVIEGGKVFLKEVADQLNPIMISLKDAMELAEMAKKGIGRAAEEVRKAVDDILGGDLITPEGVRIPSSSLPDTPKSKPLMMEGDDRGGGSREITLEGGKKVTRRYETTIEQDRAELERFNRNLADFDDVFTGGRKGGRGMLEAGRFNRERMGVDEYKDFMDDYTTFLGDFAQKIDDLSRRIIFRKESPTQVERDTESLRGYIDIIKDSLNKYRMEKMRVRQAGRRDLHMRDPAKQRLGAVADILENVSLRHGFN